MCSGIGGKGNAPKDCDGDVGDVVGEDAAEDVGESMVVYVLFVTTGSGGCLQYANFHGERSW